MERDGHLAWLVIFTHGKGYDFTGGGSKHFLFKVTSNRDKWDSDRRITQFPSQTGQGTSRALFPNLNSFFFFLLPVSFESFLYLFCPLL